MSQFLLYFDAFWAALGFDYHFPKIALTAGLKGGVTVHEYSPKSVKLAVVGSGGADNPWGIQHAHDGRAHSYFWYVSPDEFFDTHPEYFSEIGGVRVREETQLCLTNPDLLDIVAEGVEAVDQPLRIALQSSLLANMLDGSGGGGDPREAARVLLTVDRMPPPRAAISE